MSRKANSRSNNNINILSTPEPRSIQEQSILTGLMKRLSPRKKLVRSSGVVPSLSAPVKITFNKVYTLPDNLTDDDIGSYWLCDSSRSAYVWTKDGWSVYDGGEGSGGGTLDGAVLYNKIQKLSDYEKAIARENIGAITQSDIPPIPVMPGDVIVEYGEDITAVISDFISSEKKYNIWLHKRLDDNTNLYLPVEIIEENNIYKLRTYYYRPGDSNIDLYNILFDGQWKTEIINNITGNTISYSEQNLEDMDKNQARMNIGAVSESEFNNLLNRFNDLDDELHPWDIKSWNASGTVFEKGTTQTITFSWSTGLKGSSDIVLPEETIWNGVKIDNTPQSKTEIITDTTGGSYSYTLRVKRGSKDLSRSSTVYFYPRSYWGIVDADKSSLTESEVKGLQNSSILSGKGGTYSGVNLSNQKVAWCYPQRFGMITKILDGNNFDLTDSFSKSELSFENGDKYYIYILTKPVTNTGLKFIFS